VSRLKSCGTLRASAVPANMASDTVCMLKQLRGGKVWLTYAHHKQKAKRSFQYTWSTKYVLPREENKAKTQLSLTKYWRGRDMDKPIPRSSYKPSLTAFVIGCYDRRAAILGAVCHVWGGVALVEACPASAIFSSAHGLIRTAGVYILHDPSRIVRLSSASMLSCSFEFGLM
jgi:hypothetical protein